MANKLKKMSKKQQHILAIVVYTIAFFVIYLILTKGKFLWGSTVDWESQHYLIPEYFRNLFYQTHDLFPDFAFHLGGGQNIYYFSYYGFLSPIILISYFLPFVKMVNYIEITSCLIPIISAILFYFYLRKRHSFTTSFLIGFAFLCAGPMIFHSHRHIMFINYMPFLIMALFGLDRYFEKKKMGLLIVSIFLIIMTSYYYSVGALLALFLYGVYCLLKKYPKFPWQEILRLCIPFIIGILMSMVILLPTLYTLLNGREKALKGISLWQLLTPRRSFRFLLYDTYAIGLTAFSLVGILYMTFTKKRENIFLGIVLLGMSIFPIFNYLLNGTLYIDAKSLIPFLPIALLFLAPFMDKLKDNQVDYPKLWLILLGVAFITNSKVLYLDLFCLFLVLLLYRKKPLSVFLYLYIGILCFTVSIGTNMADSLQLKKTIKSSEYVAVSDLVEEILKKDTSTYRISNNVAKSITMNKVDHLEEYQSSLYSSIFNKKYNQFYFDIMNNPVLYRNRSMTPASTHPLFQMFMGEKYTISVEKPPLGSYKIMEKGKVKVYQNDFVFPLGYAGKNVVDEQTYQQLPYPSNLVTLLQNIIVPSKNTGHFQVMESYQPEFEVVEMKNMKYEKTKKGYHVYAKKKASLKLQLSENLGENMLFIRFKNNNNPKCGVPELAITIQGIKNKLSCKTWKYHNKNAVFDYVISRTQTIAIEIGEGEYDLTDFEFYLLPYDQIKTAKETIDPFKIDKTRTHNDKIVGDIDVTEEGYFTLSVPYDKGFVIWVDGKKTEYEKVNTSFLGFPITKGKHHIEIEYQAPYKKEALIISGMGVIGLVAVLFFQRRRKL